MSKTIIIAGVVVAVLAGAAAIFWPKSACSAASCSESSGSKADTVSGEVRRGEALLVDVREPEEYAAGHAAGAVLVPLGDVEAGKFGEKDKNKRTYLYCRSGKRAGAALAALKGQGYTNVENLGGLSDWQAMGGEVTK